MDFAGHYFSRQKSFQPIIPGSPDREVRIIIVIPATREEDILSPVLSICNCQQPVCKVEVIVFINGSEKESEQERMINVDAYEKLEKLACNLPVPWLKLFPIIELGIPSKWAGVGYARKTGMDQALWRFSQIERPDGLIVSFDADARCEPGFLKAVEHHLRKFPGANGLSIYFEHDFPCRSERSPACEAIISYETHLRYYKLSLQFAGFPFSYHTVGSSFAVSAKAYALQGGMNRNKAGEDFYFLQKIIPLGNFHELNDTVIHLSSRISNRVPFGTGAAMQKMKEGDHSTYYTYDLQAFRDLQPVRASATELFRCNKDQLVRWIGSLSQPLQHFLQDTSFEAAVEVMNRNASSLEPFKKRFYQWWNAFRVLKFLNYSHQQQYEKLPASRAALQLFPLLDIELPVPDDTLSIMEALRDYERNGRN